MKNDALLGKRRIQVEVILVDKRDYVYINLKEH